MSGTSNLPQFQRYVWENLPIRREAVDQEVIYDVVLVAVQFWPVEHLSQTDRNSQEEAIVLSVLTNDVRRVLTFVYGDERFRGYWLIGLRSLLPQAIGVINDWWQRRKDNRAKINTWRRKWVIDE
jgi:hypothetical protein